MAGEARSVADRRHNHGLLGALSLVCGLIAVVGLALTAQASFGTFSAFDPPGWLRILSGWGIFIGIVAAGMLGVLSVRLRSARTAGVIGIALAVGVVVIFVAMLATHPY